MFIRFEPRAQKQQQLRDELMLLLEPTRAEPGCIRVNLYESTRDPVVFFIHSTWRDEQAFNAHAQTPHMRHFLGLIDELIAHPLQAVRTREIA